VPIKIHKAVVENMKIAIIGSRSFADYELFKAKCDTILSNSKPITIISGGAKRTVGSCYPWNRRNRNYS